MKPRNKYRIVNDRYLGYEVQTKKWWLPLGWWQCHRDCGPTNTFDTVDKAEDFAKRHAGGTRVVKLLGRLP